MRVRVLLDEGALRDRRARALAARRVPVRLLPRRGPLALPLVGGLAAELPGLLLPGGPEVLSLEPVCATDELALLEPLRAARRRPGWVGAGLLASALAGAGEEIERAGFPAEGLAVDLEDPAQWDALKAEPRVRSRLVSVLGGLTGEIDPFALACEIRRLLRRGDALLVDFELGASPPLDPCCLGLAPEDVEVERREESDARLPGLAAETLLLRARRDAEARLGEERAALPAGAVLEVGPRFRFTREAALRLVEDVAAMDVLRGPDVAAGRTLLVLARPKA